MKTKSRIRKKRALRPLAQPERFTLALLNEGGNIVADWTLVIDTRVDTGDAINLSGATHTFVLLNELRDAMRGNGGTQ